MYLHSTMFLLNLERIRNTRKYMSPLHSTMFLLNRRQDWARQINDRLFTFHYVSIKSIIDKIKELPGKLIYIPLCFY